MNTPPDVLRALDRLHNTPEFRTIREWLAGVVQTETERAIMGSGELETGVARGRAQLAIELIREINGAPDATKRLEKKHGTQKPNGAVYPGSS